MTNIFSTMEALICLITILETRSNVTARRRRAGAGAKRNSKEMQIVVILSNRI